MKKMTKILLVVIIVVILIVIAILLGSCLPKEYRVGVKLDRDYPEDELPIYDDAIVYECDDDRDEITVEYGTDDDIDDVIDFYQDFYEDDGDFFYLNEEFDKDSYEAEGMNHNFEFEIEVEEPKHNPEKRAFNTIVEITIVFIEESAESVQTDAEQVDDSTEDAQELGEIDVVDVNGFDWSTVDWDNLETETTRMTDEYLRENIVGSWERVEWESKSEGLLEYSVVRTFNEDGSYQSLAVYKYDDSSVVSEGTGTWKIENQILTVEFYADRIVTDSDGTKTEGIELTYCNYIEVHKNPDYLYSINGDGYLIKAAPYGQ